MQLYGIFIHTLTVLHPVLLTRYKKNNIFQHVWLCNSSVSSALQELEEDVTGFHNNRQTNINSYEQKR